MSVIIQKDNAMKNKTPQPTAQRDPVCWKGERERGRYRSERHTERQRVGCDGYARYSVGVLGTP